MGYPLGEGFVVTVSVSELGNESPVDEAGRFVLDALCAAASTLRHPNLLLVDWSHVQEATAECVSAVAEFHKWVKRGTSSDSVYVLHFKPTPASQGDLHDSLNGLDEMAAVWQEDRLQLVGQSSLIQQDLFHLVASTPELTTIQIAERMNSRYKEKYVQNELTNLARSRCVARQRTAHHVPELTQLGRNLWHYYPLWEAS